MNLELKKILVTMYECELEIKYDNVFDEHERNGVQFAVLLHHNDDYDLLSYRGGLELKKKGLIAENKTNSAIEEPKSPTTKYTLTESGKEKAKQYYKELLIQGEYDSPLPIEDYTNIEFTDEEQDQLLVNNI